MRHERLTKIAAGISGSWVPSIPPYPHIRTTAGYLNIAGGERVLIILRRRARSRYGVRGVQRGVC